VKFQAGQRRNEPDNAALASDSASQNSLAAKASSGSSISVSIAVPVEIQAFHYFLSNYVLVPRSETSRGHWTFILPLLKGEPAGTQLSASFAAVAFASFGNRPSARQLLGKTRHEYNKALTLVNKALINPATQKSDQTLASVLLLGLYEVSYYYIFRILLSLGN
jgi:hypothetical protein